MIAREKIIERSAAEFFEANKAIAGFDNPTRSTYTSVRELVENALDAAEKGGFLPDIEIKIELMPKEEIGELMGIKDYQIDEDATFEFMRLSVRDNGIGIRHTDIPKLFGRVLTGSNYGERQSRGRFGLGAKMVLIYSQSTIRVPFEIKSRVAVSKKKSAESTSHYKLFIDIVKNAPEIVDEKKYTGQSKDQLKGHGTEVSCCFAGTWSRAKRYIFEYFEEMAVITPYASFSIVTPDNPEPIIHTRKVNVVPRSPIEVPLHPIGTDINQLKSEISRTSQKTMSDFLKKHFQRIGDKTAAEVLKISKISPSKNPQKLDEMELRRLIHEGFTKVKFFPPDGKCLSPLGHENLEAGLQDVYNTEFTCSETRPPSSYSGHAFQVEVAIGYGGEGNSPPYKLVRFANRIPLLFGEGNDLIKKTIESINWSNYKSNLNNDPLIFAVSLVSTKIPFPETSKEYIAEVDEIRKELRLCLQKAGRKLMRFQRALKKREQLAKRMKIFEKYAPITTSIVGQMLGKMDEQDFQFLFSSTQFSNCLKLREGSLFLPKNPIPVEALPMDSIEGVNLERYDIQTLQDLILIDDDQLNELISLGLSEEATDQAEQILRAILELPELAKDELVESASAKALDEFAKERGILDGLQLYSSIDPVSVLPGVGPATQKSLRTRGIRTVKDFFLINNKEITQSNLPLGVIVDLKSKCNVNVLPNITSKTVEDLHKKKIYSVLDFLETEEAKLVKIHGLTSDRINALIELIRTTLDLDIEELRAETAEVSIDEAIEDEKVIQKPKEVKMPEHPHDFIEVDALVSKLEGVGKTMAQRLEDKGIENVGKFYMVANSRLLKIKGLGAKTISTNRGNTDVLVLPRIDFEGKRDLNLMGIFTVMQFFEAEDDSLTAIRGLRSPTITKLKLDIEEKLLMTPGSQVVPKRKTTKKLSAKTPPKEPAKKPTAKKPTKKTTTTKTKTPTIPKDTTIAEYLGTKKPKDVSEEEIVVRGPPKGLLKPTLKISKLPGLGKTTEERFAELGVQTVGDLFKKSIKRLSNIRGIEEKDIIELRKMLSVEVLPHVTPAILKQLNVMGIYTVKQFQNAKIAKTSSVKGLGVKTVKAIRKHILRSFKTAAELAG
ncbi:MAG: DNA topoisomerase VI subunit B [Candidatus Heimdallarchaeota archaeon]|nr:DNA topoisomerase VI subunit B [Candidatus Heimdallarchaeota archaeon]MBY8995440.1 DNA topoisomerase VI subunit B [Candidatus Heimdallarchaeota archaeon]